MTEAEGDRRVRVQGFHAGTPGERTEQVNALLTSIPAAFVRTVPFQANAVVAATMDEEPRWEYAAPIECQAEPSAGCDNRSEP